MELTPELAEKEWKAGKFKPVYFLFGEEASARDAAIDKIKAAVKADDFNMNEFASDADAGLAPEIVAAALTPPMFAPRRLVVVKNARLGAAARKTLAQYLEEPLETTTLVLVSEEKKPDAKDALCCAAQRLSGCVIFKPLREVEAVAHLQQEARARGLELEDEAAQLLVHEAGTEWGILKAELQKALLLASDKRRVGFDEVNRSLGYRQAVNPFALTRAIEARDRALAVKLAQQLVAEGSDPFRILYQTSSALNRQLKAKRLLAAGADSSQIMRELRLPQFVAAQYLRSVGKLNERKLEAALGACVRLEGRLKSQAWLDAKAEVERLVARIASV